MLFERCPPPFTPILVAMHHGPGGAKRSHHPSSNHACHASNLATMQATCHGMQTCHSTKPRTSSNVSINCFTEYESSTHHAINHHTEVGVAHMYTHDSILKYAGMSINGVHRTCHNTQAGTVARAACAAPAAAASATGSPSAGLKPGLLQGCLHGREHHD